METVFSLAKVSRRESPVVTLGVFDGVHRGHRQVLAETVRWARKLGGTATVLTFDRHPEHVLGGGTPESITSLEHRLYLIAESDIDVCVVMHFGMELARTQPEDFVARVISETLGASGVVLGYNCRFGRGGAGDAVLLKKMGRKLGFQVREVPPLLVDGAPVSSTRIRRLIEEGQLEEAGRLLGRPFALRGTVIYGDKRGHRLGFPTANLNLHHEAMPPEGVYVCRAHHGANAHWGLVNIGSRPTFAKDGPSKKIVEAYLDDYDGERLYGETLEIEIVKFLRAEKRFASPEALTAQIEQDRRMLKTFVRRLGSDAESA